MDQNASSDYYVVASPRFVNSSSWIKANGVAILHYSNSMGPASGPLPDPPNQYDTFFSMNQARSVRLYLNAQSWFLWGFILEISMILWSSRKF